MLSLTPRLAQHSPICLPTNLSPTIQRVLSSRGISDMAMLDTQVSAMLPANHLLGLDKAVTLLDNAIDQQQKILIIGDFDCDGATSTALMVRVLRQMGGLVEFLVPDRFKYGYGLTPEIVELGINTYHPNMIVTVDNGISSHEGVNLAKKHGLTVIITDHHLTTKSPPLADAVVNPNQQRCNFASKSLVGVGVAFYVLGSLAKHRRLANKPSTHVAQYLDLVALGTVADVGVFDQNNRILIYNGLKNIQQGNCCLGILALIQQAGKQPQTLQVQDIGFVLAPCINAAGRMDNMKIGIECLLTDDWQTAQHLAYQLKQLNIERRQVEQNIRQQADDILQKIDHPPQNRSIILYQDNWHQGVIGIVAGRLKEKYHLPTIVFAPADPIATNDQNLIKGSARSIAGIHIRDAIEQVAIAYPDLISHFGGHAMAAGLSIEKQNFAAFCQAFQQVMASMAQNLFDEVTYTDGQLLPQEFSLDFYHTLAKLSIWGHGFVPPIFDGIFTIVDFQVLKERHLKLWLSHTDVVIPLQAIWFSADFEQLPIQDIVNTQSQIHALYQLEKNEFNQQVNLQLQIKKAVLINETNTPPDGH